MLESRAIYFQAKKESAPGNIVTFSSTELCFTDADEHYVRKILAISLLLQYFHMFISFVFISLNMSIFPRLLSSLNNRSIQNASILFDYTTHTTIHHLFHSRSIFRLSRSKILYSRQHVLIDLSSMRIATIVDKRDRYSLVLRSIKSLFYRVLSSIITFAEIFWEETRGNVPTIEIIDSK